jgi:steroid 5-alpha reductase family enzyme
VIWWNLLASLGAALAVLLVTFAFGVAMGKHRVVDIAWGLAFSAIAVTTYAMSSGHGDAGRRAVVTALTVIWGVRLAGHIFLRARGADEDPRYQAMLSKATGNRNVYALTRVYLLQAVIAWFVSLPVQVAQYDPNPLAWWAAFGIAVWAVGFVFESVGDWQLTRFKADPSNKGKVLDIGLWRYTRHPNYFGDACVWWGLYLLAVGTWWGAATILSPIAMTYFLAGKTGRPLMDEHMMNTRPEYADYTKRTSGFIPRPPRTAV